MYIYIYQNILYVHIRGLVYTRIQVYLVLLHFVLSCTEDNIFFTNLRFAVTLRQTNLLALFSQCHLLTSTVLHFWWFSQYFKLFKLLLYLLWWSVVSDLWCYYYKKIITHWRLRWWLAFFINKSIFKLRYVHCLIRHNAIAQFIHCSRM